MSTLNHSILGRVQARAVEFERRTVFGADSALRMYLIEPGGRTLIGKALKSGWSAQQADGSWRVEILDAEAMGWPQIRGAAEVEIETHVATQLFRVTKVKAPMEAGHAWVLEIGAIGRD